MASPQAFTLGERVTWDRYNELARYQVQSQEPAQDDLGKYRRTVYRKEWRSVRDHLPQATEFSPAPQERSGIVVGVRTLANGVLRWGSEDEPTELLADEYVPAVLVSWDLHRRPVYVSPPMLRPVAPEAALAVADRHGDVWTPRADGLWETPETAPFPWEHVARKWGPLHPVP